MMNRTRKLNRYCKGRRKGDVAMKQLRIPPAMLSYLLRHDIDRLIARIDALPMDQMRDTA